VTLQRSDGNCKVLADSHWEMLLKAVEQLLDTAKRVYESHWEMSKDIRPYGQFLSV
jgi:hypothetical protein